MIHARQSDRSAPGAQGRIPARAAPRRSRGGAPARAVRLFAAAGALGALLACDGNGGVDPETLRFAQIGSLEIRLEVPLRLGEGQLTQELSWRSNGRWSLTESISYRGLPGDQTVLKSGGDPAELALPYDGLNRALNEEPAQRLFTPDLPTDLVPTCDETETRLTFTLHDEARGEDVSWIRCVQGSLNNLTPLGAGPDPAASRLALATLLAREATVGERWLSAYQGSVPFGTLDRGDDPGAPAGAPVTYIDVSGFNAFWARHAPGKPLPAVDFTREMVVVAFVGVRREAGDSVEVRRILQVAEGSLIEVHERVPGEFCSPKARTQVPYHVVVAPRTPVPHRFAEVRMEPVPCGG